MKMRNCGIAVLALTMLNAACAKKEEGSQPGAAAAPAASSTTNRQNLAQLVDLIVAEAADLPRAEFDPAALAKSLGNDPQKHFEWVRDRTWWAPYRGLLRGAQGVLLDRVGSNLDRAVLLGDLLRRSGHTVRLAHAQLPESRARELLAKVRPMPAQRRAPVAQREPSAERNKAMAALVPDIHASVKAQADRSVKRTGEAAALLNAQSDALLTAVRGSVAGNANDGSAVIAALRDHWWVERDEGGKWVAMDVLVSDTASGESTATATTRSNWSAADDFPAVADVNWHSVRLQVVVERFDSGATSESTVLDWTFHPAKVLGQTVALRHVPVPWPTDLADGEVDGNKLRTAALAVRQWMPYLQAGDELIVQSGFDNGGQLQKDPMAAAESISDLGSGGEGGRSIADGIGGFGAAEAMPAVTAEWLDFEVRVPGAEPERLRRPVFDLLGPTRRANKSGDFDGTTDLRKLERFEALWGHIGILLQPCELTADFVADRAVAGVLANERTLKEISTQRDAAAAQRLATEMHGHLEPQGPLPGLALWRSELGGQGRDWFIDRANVLSHRIGRRIVNTENAVVRQTIDIASNSVGTRPGANSSPFEVRLRQGVADTVAEMTVLGSDAATAENTASVFARLAAEGMRGLLIGARDLAAVGKLPWPDDEAARVRSDVDAGYMTVVPRKAVLIDELQRVGWWRVHPVSGETIGVMDTGLHSASENTTLRSITDRLLGIKARHYQYRTMLEEGAREGLLTAQQQYHLQLFRAVDALATAVGEYRLMNMP